MRVPFQFGEDGREPGYRSKPDAEHPITLDIKWQRVEKPYRTVSLEGQLYEIIGRSLKGNYFLLCISGGPQSQKEDFRMADTQVVESLLAAQQQNHDIGRELGSAQKIAQEALQALLQQESASNRRGEEVDKERARANQAEESAAQAGAEKMAAQLSLVLEKTRGTTRRTQEKNRAKRRLRFLLGSGRAAIHGAIAAAGVLLGIAGMKVTDTFNSDQQAKERKANADLKKILDPSYSPLNEPLQEPKNSPDHPSSELEGKPHMGPFTTDGKQQNPSTPTDPASRNTYRPVSPDIPPFQIANGEPEVNYGIDKSELEKRGFAIKKGALTGGWICRDGRGDWSKNANFHWNPLTIRKEAGNIVFEYEYFDADLQFKLTWTMNVRIIVKPDGSVVEEKTPQKPSDGHTDGKFAPNLGLNKAQGESSSSQAATGTYQIYRGEFAEIPSSYWYYSYMDETPKQKIPRKPADPPSAPAREPKK